MEYKDDAFGTMIENADGSGKFNEVVLHPQVVIADGTQKELVNSLHAEANKMCFIANSLNFVVQHIPYCTALNE